MKPRGRYYLAAYEAVQGVRQQPSVRIAEGWRAVGDDGRLYFASPWMANSDIGPCCEIDPRRQLQEQERRRRARRETAVALAIAVVCIAVAVVSALTGWGF